MTTVDFEPLSVTVPLWEDPPGVFRVGNSRVLLELVIGAFKRGEAPEGIVRYVGTLHLAGRICGDQPLLGGPRSFRGLLAPFATNMAEAVRRNLDGGRG